ncbi:MAG: hypothetical protein GWO10_25005, partial [candidate division Zixibacteria bacterium]|nr:hypothetical protein [candidate division Zixibacteria bacterium]
REMNYPQYHRQDIHQAVWKFCAELDWQDYYGLAYNSTGAYASVNHLHLQMYCRNQPLPIELPLWRHNHGDRDYPLNCYVYDDAETAWQTIDMMH